MTDLLRGRDFAIDGTGRVIRAGDDIIVSPMSLASAISGPARVVAFAGGGKTVVAAGDVEEVVLTKLIRRADDTERTPDGAPLWCWM